MTTPRVSPARLAAHRVLFRADDPKAPGLDVLLEEQAGYLKLDARDLALARQIAWGTLRHRCELEMAVGQHLKRGFPRADVEWALLAGAFQHIGLERIPVHAIVSETVELVRQLPKGEAFAGLANAVMRKVTRGHDAFDETAPWHERHSVPEWLRREAEDALPEAELEEFFRASNEPAPLCVRIRDASAADFFADDDRRETPVPGCAVLTEAKSVDDLPGFAEGRVTIEDEGAQIACLLAAPDSTAQSVLDLCASPGGKTSHLADIVAGDCRILATDVSPRKLARLRSTLERLRLEGRVETGLAGEIPPDAVFDYVLVDAPCSGLGTLRRHPEIRFRRSPGAIAELATLQREILDGAADRVAPGGVLAYSVCTWSKAECEDTVAHFLAGHPEFRPAEEAGTPGFSGDPYRCGAGMWRTWTHRHGCDGFFVARMRRAGD